MEIGYRHSEQLNELADALAKAQAKMDGAKKDSTNPHFKSKYADLESVWDACRGPLTAEGLSVLQPVSAQGTKVVVTTMLLHKSGQWLASDLEMTAQQNTPQAVGSVITYGRRYGLSSMAGIAPEDDDGNEGSQRGQQPPPPPQRQSAPPTQPKPQPAPKKEWDYAKAISAVSGMKEHVGEKTYREILGRHGYEKANEIKTREEMTKVYNDLATEAQRLKESGNAA